MGLTQLQASNQYIVDSIAQFLYRNVVPQYNAAAAATTGKTPDYSAHTLGVVEGKPDDPSVIRRTPVIAISTLTAGGKDRFLEIGTARLWRHKNFVFYCYPSVDSAGQPCSPAAWALQTAMQNAFGTETIKVVDYSNPACTPTNILYCSYNMSITNVQEPMPRGKTSAIAEEKHRFDMHVSVQYPVIETLAT